MWALKETRAGRATVPSTIESEKETNPFMRVRRVVNGRRAQVVWKAYAVFYFTF